MPCLSPASHKNAHSLHQKLPPFLGFQGTKFSWFSANFLGCSFLASCTGALPLLVTQCGSWVPRLLVSGISPEHLTPLHRLDRHQHPSKSHLCSSRPDFCLELQTHIPTVLTISPHGSQRHLKVTTKAGLTVSPCSPSSEEQ